MLQKLLRNSNRSLSKSKKSKANPATINPKILQVYGLSKKNQKGTNSKKPNRPNLNENSKCSRSNTSTYDFPQFSIRFEEESRAAVEAKRSSRKKSIHQPESYRKYPVIRQEIEANSARKSILKMPEREAPLEIKQDRTSDRVKFSIQYNQAISKIFRALDIFNRGKISEANINKWVPQSALYFLGKVFQSIRQSRLTITEQQFIKMCEPLLLQSNEEDVHWFIKEVNTKQMMKVSINISQQQNNNEMSPIQKRMRQEELMRSQTKPIITKNSQLNEVIELIQDKQKDVNQKLRMIKDKQRAVPMGVLEQNNGKNYIRSSINEPYSQKYGHQSSQKVNQFNPYEQNSPKKHLYSKDTQYRQVSSTKAAPIHHRIPERSSQIPNFTFQIPQAQPYQSKQPNRILAYLQRQDSFLHNNEQNGKNSYCREQQTPQKPHTTRTNYQSVTSNMSREPSSQTKRSVAEQNERLDKLSHRLEQYIRMNVSKIETSKIFTRENSIPKR